MSSRSLFRSALLSALCLLFAGVSPAFADSSHARIIRLSLIQGDARFARDVHGDPLADQNAAWEAAVLNLPIRQGYVLATDKGRAEVEFENGAMAFLAEDTVLEFYDLSLTDGAKTTRLVLRQGSASFYVNPAGGDYFSVTGGDFTVEAVDRTSFRVDNFDDGSTVNVLKGRISLLRKDKTTTLAKGQSFSMRAGDDSSVSIDRLPDNDDFDRWVSGRIDSVATATTAAQQYVSSPYYTSGLADLYTYGSWYPVAGYGHCWRPYGVGLGWSPFTSGGWFMDPVFGWSFMGSQPWGWLPYHFGGWIYDPVFGWLWSPGGLGYGAAYGYVPWRPVTGVWVRSKPGLIGIVPVHPLDAHGKPPINLAHGVFPVRGGGINERVPVNTGENWKVVKTPPGNTLTSRTMVASAPPPRVSRTIAAGSVGTHVIAVDHNSSIAYDPREHRFVNANSAPASAAKTSESAAEIRQNTPVAGEHVSGQTGPVSTQVGRVTITPVGTPTKGRVATPPAAARPATAYAPRSMTPPPAPRSSESSRGGSRFEPSSRSSSASSASASHAAAASTPHASAPASSGHPH
jgi:hypothetical protein